MKIFRVLACAAGGMLVSASLTSAAIVIEHVGDVDPATEGWTFNDFTSGTGAQSPGTDTESYWRIQRDASTAGRYIADLSIIPGGLDALTDPTGWTATARVKLTAAEFAFQTWLSVDDSDDLWSLHLFDGTGSQASGAYMVENYSLMGIQLSTIDPKAAYNSYQIVYDPADGGSVKYYLDGTVIGTQNRDSAPHQGVLRVEFGDSERGVATNSQWSLVRFETGQRPIAPPHHPGDFDSDGDVDGADFVAWQTHFPTASGATLPDGDADGDGDVDGADFVVWQTNFPYTPGPGVAPVPEPTSVCLASLGGFMAISWRYRRRWKL